MKTIILLAALITSSVACASVTVDDNVCSSKQMSFPGVTPAISALAGERTSKVTSNTDMSGSIGKIADIAEVEITSVHLNVDSNSDLNFLHHVKVTIHSVDDVNNELVLSDADFSSVDLPVIVDNGKLLSLLKKGPATLVFTGTGSIPTSATSATTSLCIGVSAQGDKSL